MGLLDMTVKYIFRLDDIAPNMKEQNYLILKDIFTDQEVKPLIAVIPDNQDPRLKEFPLCSFNFWREVREVRDYGWEVALHGYRHEYVTDDPGILGISAKSEFAGLPFGVQLEKLKRGKEILNQHGIDTEIFVAPSHSFDDYTIEALKEVGITSISDGFALFPYWHKNILFVPQLFEKPKELPVGIYTFCLHLNNLDDSFFTRLRFFIHRNRKDIISFDQSKNFTSNHWYNKFIGLGAKVLLNTIRKRRK
jgi:predicted deacetylase